MSNGHDFVSQFLVDDSDGTLKRFSDVADKATYDPDDDGVIALAQLEPIIPSYRVNPLHPIPDSRGIEILAMVVRQNDTDLTQWDVISDGGHYSVGVDQLSFTASTSNLTVEFPDSGSILTFIASPDESLAKRFAFTIGASVTDHAVLQASAQIWANAKIYYDGVDWVVSHVATSANRDLDLSVRWLGGVLYVDNTYVPTSSYAVNAIRPPADTNLIPRFVAQHGTATTSSTPLKFHDGTSYLSTADTSMAIMFTQGITQRTTRLDGTSGSDRPNFGAGNVWIICVRSKY